ncbi:MAG TPA: hypothetical protein VFR90_00655 [Methylibium sp.]|uniref:hypothetical protein n=1 Tax=Methylibium sp. TaxID=2067992 RepID=UPI002DB8CFE2|nr:hypothetical protein [Methylibium sp.]HEU4457615.1 hypothetical protein [Methylibium sp.]
MVDGRREGRIESHDVSTFPSPLHGPVPSRREARPARHARARRLLAGQALAALAFDLAIFVAMARLGWELLMPWSRALDAADGLWLVGLLVCAGLWAAFVTRDLSRWQRLARRRR